MCYQPAVARGSRLALRRGSVLQVISLVPEESESGHILMALLRNFRLLSAGWRNEPLSSDPRSSVPIYSLDVPPLVRSGKAGRLNLRSAKKYYYSSEV